MMGKRNTEPLSVSVSIDEIPRETYGEIEKMIYKGKEKLKQEKTKKQKDDIVNLYLIKDELIKLGLNRKSKIYELLVNTEIGKEIDNIRIEGKKKGMLRKTLQDILDLPSRKPTTDNGYVRSYKRFYSNDESEWDKYNRIHEVGIV